MRVNFMNLDRQNVPLTGEFQNALQEIIAHGRLVGGPELLAFEKAFAQYHDAQYCVGTSNGTTALQLGMAACGIGPGDEVITVPNTFIATVEAIAHCGAKPVLVDVDSNSLEMDPDKIEAAITTRTKAVLPVHLFGCPAPMKEICSIAEKHDLMVFEDAAQAHGAFIDGKKIGNSGQFAGFSFYPGKNLGALGDGGAVLVNDERIYKRMLMLRDHGSDKKYEHKLVGYNFRMDTFTAAALNIKLKHLDEWTEIRRKRADLYRRELDDSGIMFQVVPSNVKHAYHIFLVMSDRRDELIRHLNENGIGTNIHYPIPVHLQPAFEYLGYQKGDFPVAEKAAKQIVSLPMCANITEEEVQYVAETIKSMGLNT